MQLHASARHTDGAPALAFRRQGILAVLLPAGLEAPANGKREENEPSGKPFFLGQSIRLKCETTSLERLRERLYLPALAVTLPEIGACLRADVNSAPADATDLQWFALPT